MGDAGRDPARPQFSDALLHRRLSDPLTDVDGERAIRAAVAARRSRLSGAVDDRTSAGRIALVTGASRGIGRAAALALAGAGAHVVAVARTVGGLEELDDEIKATGGSARWCRSISRDAEGIDQLGAALYERWQRLDILVGNAGMLGTLSPLGHIEPKTWEEVMAVNVTANWRLIRSMDPLLRAIRGGPRDVRHLGRARWTVFAYWGPYAVSKAALEALVKDLCRRDGDDRHQRQSAQSRPDPHPHARRGHAWRGPRQPAAAGGGGGSLSPAGVAEPEGKRIDL